MSVTIRVRGLSGPVHDWFVVPAWVDARLHAEGIEHEHAGPPIELTAREPEPCSCGGSGWTFTITGVDRYVSWTPCPRCPARNCQTPLRGSR